jgi:dTDP-4-dehydrorhamnose 3,5-epimerase
MFEETPIEGLLIYRPRVFEDQRGYFFESFNRKHFEEKGITANFVQDNRSLSKKGTLRGLHFQLGQDAQAKLVGVLSGEVYDVAVDLRRDSKTFGQHFGINLDSIEKKFFYIPRGFAHGFVVLSETAEFFYKCDNFYAPQSDSGIHFADSDLGIDWPIDSKDTILSDKDAKLPSFEQWRKDFPNEF